MAITTKLILRTNKILPDGGHPIVFRITENRRVYEVATKESSLINQWISQPMAYTAIIRTISRSTPC